MSKRSNHRMESMNACSICHSKQEMEALLNVTPQAPSLPSIYDSHFPTISEEQKENDLNFIFSKKHGVSMDILHDPNEDSGERKKNKSNFDKRLFWLQQIQDNKMTILLPPKHEEMDLYPNQTLCLECFKNITQQIREETNSLEKETKNLLQTKQYLFEHQQTNIDENSNTQEENNRIKELQMQLENIESSSKTLHEKLRDIYDKSQEVKKKEESYWKVFHYTKEYINDAIIEKSGNEKQIAYVNSLLEDFKTTKMFSLGYEKVGGMRIGTISNLKLGGKDINAIKDEMNAALGLCALLLREIIYSKNISLSKYTIVPIGSKSYLESIETGEKFPLYFTNIRTFTDFNKGMGAFVECVREVNEHPIVKSTLKRLELLQSVPDERKLMLTFQQGQVVKLEDWTRNMMELLICLRQIQKIF